MKGSFLNVWAPAGRTRPSAAQARTGMLTGTSVSCHTNHCRSYNIRVYLFLSTLRWCGSGGLRWSEDTGGLIHRDTAAIVTPQGRCRGPSGVPGLAPGGRKWLCKSSPMLVKGADFSTRQTSVQILALLPPGLVPSGHLRLSFPTCKMGMTNLTGPC